MKNTSRSTDPIPVGLVGAGAIGSHHARILSGLPGVRFLGIHDVNVTSATEVCNATSSKFFERFEDLLTEAKVLFVAAPTVLHYEFASLALNRGIDLFIEKPIADTGERARKIVDAANNLGRVVAVGHVERFNPVVRWLKENLLPQTILSVNITRVGPRPPRIKDVGIVVDLAVHDIDLISHICQSEITIIQAVTRSTSGEHEDVAQINLKTGSGAVCSISTNWLTPYKSRKIEIATADAFFVGDLIVGTITKYEGVDLSGTRFIVEIQTPRGREPLLEQAAAFFNLVRGEGPSPNATAEEGCRNVELALHCLGRV